jgi:hypothetical protein
LTGRLVAAPHANMTDISRKFLAVSDETEECLKALIFAGMRAKAVGSV